MGAVLAKDSVLGNLASHSAAPRGRAALAVSLTTLGLLLYAGLRRKTSSGQRLDTVLFSEDHKEKKAEAKVAVDLVFAKRLLHLIKVLIPGPFTKEFGLLVLVAAAMILRTWADVWMLKNGTAIERMIVGRDYPGFMVHFTAFIMAFFPLAVINNILKYGLDEMHLSFRQRLTTYLYREYMTGFTFYKVSNLDNRISNADQLLTQDVDKFCYSVAQLYSNITKPILDIWIYAGKLTGSIGFQGPASMLAYLVVSGALVTRLRRPVARFTVLEQKLEGEYRYVNSRLITHSEEVAFYGGSKKESEVIHSSFSKLVAHLRKFMQFRFGLGVIDSIIGKYCATLVGYLVVSRPFFDLENPEFVHASYSELMEAYYRSGRMLMNLALAVGRLILAGRELTRLAGFTARVIEFERVLADLNKGKYVRTMVQNGKAAAAAADSKDASSSSSSSSSSPAPAAPLVPNAGKILTQDHVISFDNVPIVTPNGDVLVPSMTFSVHSGMNVLVCGPNGCGKSSLFRILGELWPLFGGVLTKPVRRELFYVPQKPYLCLGTLRDQITYPHTREECKARFRKSNPNPSANPSANPSSGEDAELERYLEWVALGYLVKREEDGLDAVHDWADVLSGGEKQRVAMARLFYHRPQFAILDECTSAVSVDVEGLMYEKCKEMNITLFTVSHRKSLWRHHEYLLQFDGRGAVQFGKISEQENAFGS